jgi:hypothetical protein
VVGITAATGCTAYDAEFVALARHLSAPLVTAHRRLRSAAPGLPLSIADFAEGADLAASNTTGKGQGLEKEKGDAPG